MTSFHQKSQRLIEKAEHCEWNLDCDEKLLELMQNVAGKIESRSATTRSNINTMMLGLDETKVKLSNLTRINSIKNTNYCENLIREDHLDVDSGSDEVPKREPVKLSPQIAIGNGIKLLENCFEKHKVNLDPSSSQSTTSTVYRPIDKYMNVLPHLIGSDKWNEKWHVGLLDTDVTSHAGSEQYAESVESNATPATSILPSIEEKFIPGSSLMASQDSLAKSTSSIGDQMVINQPGALFDDDEHFVNPNAPSSMSFFRPQVDQRKIVNLFDDEPPSMEPSPTAERRPANLFDDYGSVESLPAPPENAVRQQPVHQQPVDLFNDSEFNDFIKKIETQSGASTTSVVPDDVQKPVMKAPQATGLPDMRKISEEIKKVQLKKVEPGARIVVKKTVVAEAAKKSNPVREAELPKASVPVKTKELEVNPEPQGKQRPKKIANLFDDEDEPDDFFNEIIKQKATSKAINEPPKAAPTKKKLTSLFDDEDDDDDTFGSFLNKKPVANSLFSDEGEPAKVNKKSTSLFDDDDEPSRLAQTKPETVKNKTKSLFAEDDVSVSFEKKLKAVETVEAKVKPPVPEPPEIAEPLAVMVEPVSKSVEAPMVQVPDVEPEVVEETTKIVKETVPEPIVPDIAPEIAAEPATEVHVEAPAPTEKVIEEKLLFSAQTTSSTLPFLNDEPPDDDETWETDVQYDDSEPIFRPTSSSYPTVPIFDDMPPEDDFVAPTSSDAPELFTFEDEDEVQPIEVPQMVLSVPKEPELPQVKSSDELDRSVGSSSIKSKLDMFSKRVEEVPPASMPKKLPGKLNMSIKINVGALMPGARLPTRDVVERSADREETEDERSIAESTPTAVTSIDPNNNSSLLNNELAKSRAKIKVKRRPSTRRGRQSNYQRSMSLNVTEDEPDDDVSDDKLAHSATIPSLVAPSKNLSVSIFDDMEDDDEIVVGFKEPIDDKKVEKSFAFVNEPPPAEPSSKAVTTSKISVFYDDEDDTRLMVEQHRKLEEEKVSQQTPSGLFDDDDGDDFLSKSFTPPIKTVPSKAVQSRDVLSASYDESDDDLFGTRSVPEVVNKPIKQPAKIAAKSVPKPKQSNSLFDDVDDDDLFESASKKATPIVVKKPSKLFESDDETEPNSSIIFSKPDKAGQPKKQSLFGDDESDDGDLFSSKPKSSSKSIASTSKSSTIVKKQTTKAVDDPLKDLLNN